MSDFSSDGSLPVGRASLSEKDDATITITQPLSAAIADGQLKPAQSSYKVEQIRRACCDRDCAALVTFAKTEGGLLDDDVRREACMISIVHPTIASLEAAVAENLHSRAAIAGLRRWTSRTRLGLGQATKAPRRRAGRPRRQSLVRVLSRKLVLYTLSRHVTSVSNQTCQMSLSSESKPGNESYPI
jgi:hypothetical protein